MLEAPTSVKGKAVFLSCYETITLHFEKEGNLMKKTK